MRMRWLLGQHLKKKEFNVVHTSIKLNILRKIERDTDNLVSLFFYGKLEILGGTMAKYWKWGFVMIAAVWAALIGTMLGCGWNKTHPPGVVPDSIQSENTNLSIETQEKMEGYWTVALFGVDSREGHLGKGTRSDMEMVCNINLGTGEIRLVSIYRDTFVKINEKNRYDKINEAYFQGGPKQAIYALNENMDLTVDDYASFSWRSVVDAINLLGGIDVEITPEEFKVINGFITETVESTAVGSHHLKESGLNHLDGVQAVAYARLRKMDTDFQRTKRQRKVVELVLQKAKNADIMTLTKVVQAVIPQISTSIGIKDLLPLIKQMKQFHLTEAKGFPFDLKDVMIGKRDCVIPVTLEKNVIELHKFLFDEESYEPSDHVKEISNQIIQRSKKGK